jgi:integrase
VKDTANAYLNHKHALLAAGELSVRTWTKYKQVADLVVSQLGKTRLVADLRYEDFAALKSHMSERWGPWRVADFVTHIKSVFGHAFTVELIDKPVRFGPGFEKPSAKTLRIHRAQQGPKLFTADEIRRMLDAASVQVKAMILLGINCGFGNSDCGTLPLRAVDLAAGMIDFPRPKTGISRRCVLWPETVQAIRDALAHRPKLKKPEHAGHVFITAFGLPWFKPTADNVLTGEVTKLLKKLRINGRKGLGFYTLRHVFRTVADEVKDQPAVDFVMGHTSTHMSTVYRETISDARLRAVADHVRAWLFQQTKTVQ